MWVTVTFAYLIPALVVTAKLLSGERKAAAQAQIVCGVEAPTSCGVPQ